MISFKYVANFKLILLVNGMQTVTSTNPCPYCFVCVNDLENRKELIKCELDGKLQLKAYGNLKEDCNRFVTLNCNKKLAKQFNNTVNPPLFLKKRNTGIGKMCAPGIASVTRLS